MASITMSGWAPNAAVSVYVAVEAGRSFGAVVSSAQADSSGSVTIDGLAERVRYTASDGSQRRHFVVPDQAQVNRSSGLPAIQSDALASLQAAVDAAASGAVVPVIYGVPVAGQYKARPPGAAVVMWLGPVAPAIGGAGAQENDVWRPTA